MEIESKENLHQQLLVEKHPEPVDSKFSYYHEIMCDSTDFSDSMGQIIYYENTITQDFFSYLGLLWLGLSLSIGLTIFNFFRPGGTLKAITFVFELFSFYTWFVGIDAKNRLKMEVQRCFMICLAGIVVIKSVVFVIDCFTLMNWRHDFRENVLIENNKFKSVDLHLIFSFLQIALGVYIYPQGKRLMKLFIKRRAVILNEDKSITDGLAIL